MSFAVPVFVMISGALFLNRDIPLERIYTKYASRLLIAWLAWSILYVSFLDGGVFFKIWSVLNSLSQPRLRFLPLMIGLYICIPFFKRIVASDEVVKYFLTLAFIFNFLIPTVSVNIDFFGNDYLYKLKRLSGIDSFVALMGMQAVLGFSPCFILSYYLDKKELSPQTRIVVYTLGILAVVATYCCYWSEPYKNPSRSPDLFVTEQNVALRRLFMSAAILVFVKRFALERNRFVESLSNLSVGAYLVHYLLIKLFAMFLHLDATFFTPVVSFSISALLHKIPIVNRYLA